MEVMGLVDVTCSCLFAKIIGKSGIVISIRTKRISAISCWTLGLLLVGFAITVDSALAQDQPQPRLGMNLNGPADWNTELPFVDVFRLSRPWISQQEGKPWGQGPELVLDAHGWVKQLQSDCMAETILCTIADGHYPSGPYTVYYDGHGELEGAGAARVVSRAPGRLVLDVDSTKGSLFLRLTQTDPDDYVRNIRVIMPGYAETYQKAPFHPVFLQRWSGVACFRFMDWMQTNGSKIRQWSDRPQLQDATFTEKGIAAELMIDLCNRQRADAWFCMPHLADNDYVRKFAQLVKKNLDPELKVYVEYSNEVWNSQFAQTRYSWEKGKELGLGDAERPWEGGGMYYAQRSVEIFKIWEEVFGGTDQLVRVLAWQAGNTWWMNGIVLPHQEAFKHTDAIAIAPYVGMNVPADGNELTASDVSTWSLERVLDHMQQKSLPKAIEAIQATHETADKFGLQLLAYEGGQHMVGVAGGENNEAMTKLFQAANADPRMGDIYREYYAAWTQAGGSLFCYFSSIGRWSKWGSWGIMQHYDDDPTQSPKFIATMQWAKDCGQKVNVPQ